MRRLAVLAFLVIGCGEIPPDVTTGAVSVPMCDPYAVGGNKKCGTSPTPAYVECMTYPYNKATGAYQGNVPTAGCILAFMADPQTPYSATCVASCADVGL